MSGDDRLIALDAVRGVAVMGILLLNIVAFAMPTYAYIDPYHFGGATGANWWAWAIAFVVADGKMRGLFTILFGASTALVVERARTAGESGARVHFARMAVLLGFGLVHAWLIWSGDILVLYAVAGALLYGALHWPMRALITASAALMLLQLGVGLADHAAARRFEAAASASGATPALRQDWARFRESLLPSAATARREIAAYRGGYGSVQRARAAETWVLETRVLPAMLPETLALMLAGVALYRSGFFAGRWPRRRLAAIIAIGVGMAIPAYGLIVAWIDGSRFDPTVLLATEPIHLVLLRPWLSLAYAAAVVLLVTGGRARWMMSRFAATGRMAFSNYLGTSVVCTALFYGYGFGLYARLERWQLYPIVLAIWIVMAAVSSWWLARFAHGPMEWLWRSLARGRAQRFMRH